MTSIAHQRRLAHKKKLTLHQQSNELPSLNWILKKRVAEDHSKGYSRVHEGGKNPHVEADFEEEKLDFQVA